MAVKDVVIPSLAELQTQLRNQTVTIRRLVNTGNQKDQTNGR